MSRKDYELIAAAFAEANADMVDSKARTAGSYQAARNLARYLKRDNPRFDRERFLKACGVTL